jgi:hypothetical protein
MFNQKPKLMTTLCVLAASLLPRTSLASELIVCQARPGLAVDALERIQEDLPAAEVQPQLDRISAACTERKDLSCTIIQKGFSTLSGVLAGRILMRVIPAGVTSLTEIATRAAKVTNQEHHVQDHEAWAAKIEADIAMNAENRRRIENLLSQSGTPIDQTLDLTRELAAAEEQLAMLQIEHAGLHERRTVLVIEMNVRTFSK